MYMHRGMLWQCNTGSSGFRFRKDHTVAAGQGSRCKCTGGTLWNALQAASHQGHDTIVQVLLGEGMDINAQGGNFGNALQAASASYKVHEKTVAAVVG